METKHRIPTNGVVKQHRFPRIRKWAIKTIGGTLLLGLGLTGVGCESQAANGALLGGAGGAGLGAIIGHNSHGRTAEGALIGGAIGAVGGGLIGNEVDKNHQRREQDYYDRDGYYHRYDAPPPPPRGYYDRNDRYDHYNRY